MASKKKQPVATQETVAAPVFKLTIKLADKVLVGVGPTALAALQAIPKPNKIVSKSTLTMEYGDQKTERFFMPHQLHRVFYSSPKLQEIHAKQLSLGLVGRKI